MMKTIIIEGTKGAGKTTVIKNLFNDLSSKYRVKTYSPYGEGNQKYIHIGGIFHCWSDKVLAREAFSWLKSSISQTIKDAQNDGTDILIFDRNWITIVRCIEDSVLDNEEKESLIKEFKQWLTPIDTFFIYCSPETTMIRRYGELDAKSGLNTTQLVIEDFNRRYQIAMEHGLVSFDTTNPEIFDTNEIITTIKRRLTDSV